MTSSESPIDASIVDSAEVQRSGELGSGPSQLGALVHTYPVAVVAVAAGIAARVVFWAMTDRRFEDALITVAHAQNAVAGLGLTHHAGEPNTHGFTSAISVLVPLVGEIVIGGAGLEVLRVVSLLAFAAAIACAAGIGQRLEISQWLMIFPFAYLAFDQNQIFYGMAGMETQIATAILLAAIYALMTHRVVLTGAVLGLALLARPDFVLLVVPALLYLVLRSRRDALVAGSVATSVVLPWLVFTTLYYGSPVPNTIRAKSLRYPADLPALTQPVEWPSYLWAELAERHAVRHMWTPLLENGFVDHVPVDVLLLACVAISFMALAVLGAWRGRRTAGWNVAVAYGALFLLYRVYLVPSGYYEWYVAPFMALAAVAAASGLASLRRPLVPVAVTASCALAVAFAAHVPATFVLEQRVQRIEDRVRVPMATYLDNVVKPGERVVSESAGYVGYYSGVTLYDYPGLTSPGAVETLEELRPRSRPLSIGLHELTNALRPEWLVMRPDELRDLEQLFPETAAAYTLDRAFSVPVAESGLHYRGVGYLNWDRDFLILRRVGTDR